MRSGKKFGPISKKFTLYFLQAPSLRAIDKILIFDRKNLSRLDRKSFDLADPAARKSDLRVVNARHDAGDLQALVMIDAFILVVQALVLAEFVGSRGRETELGHCRGREVPKPRRFFRRARGGGQ